MMKLKVWQIWLIIGSFCSLVGILGMIINSSMVGQIAGWILNIIYAIALVVIIRLSIKATEALDIYINDKKSSRS